MLKSAIVLLVCLAASALADVPVNCSYPEIEGNWIFQETERREDKSVNCTTLPGPLVHTSHFQLLFPDVVVDEFGHQGHWTMISNQGFEITINQRRYFAYPYYEVNNSTVTYNCDRSMNGWSHDITVRNWACYTAQKEVAAPAKVLHIRDESHLEKEMFKNDLELIDRINSVQKSWTAKPYKKFEGMTLKQIQRMSGGSNSRIYNPVEPAPMTEELRQRTAALPDNFDWSNHNGQNFVTPVRDQADCGSCFAFSSLAMYEARLKIITNNSVDLVFSPQDVIGCSQYSQGCDGGFTYLISGKYAMDFGLVEESCNPYQAVNSPCLTDQSCIRHYSSYYQYVGGFYGACNEEVMREAIYNDGPVSCSFMVYDDFRYYSGGVYHHIASGDDSDLSYDPYQGTNHAVLCYGWGVESSTGEKFWRVKNSWGSDWGESGNFRITRGVNECAIESGAVETRTIP